MTCNVSCFLSPWLRDDDLSDSDPGTRPVIFDQAAQEAGMSRIDGEIHFSFDNTAGLALRSQVGNYVMSHELAALTNSQSANQSR